MRGAEKFTGRRLDPIRVIGGGAASEVWCQILADVCDRTLERVADPLLTGLRGAALMFGLATGAVRAADVPGLVPVVNLPAEASAPGNLRRAVCRVPRPALAKQADVRPPQPPPPVRLS